MPPTTIFSAPERRLSKFSKTSAIALTVLSLCAGMTFGAGAPAKETTPEERFKAGIASFQSGDYASAASNFESLLGEGPTDEALESILFALASTYYNQKDLKKSEEYYNRCINEFPKGKNATKALIALSGIQKETGRKDEAEATLKKAAASGGDLAIQATLAEAAMQSDAGNLAGAAETLRPLVAGGLKDDTSVQAALALANVESKLGHTDEALKLLDKLRASSDLVDNPMFLDYLAVGLGDALLKKKETKKALRIYAAVRPKNVVTELQKTRIAALEKRIVDNKASMVINPKAFMQINAANAALAARVAELKASLDQFDKSPDVAVPVRIRQAKAYGDLNQKWEAILLWETLMDTGDPKLREDALFSIASSYGVLGRTKETGQIVDKYQAEFPDGKYAVQASFLKGNVSMEAGDYAAAETVFGTLIKKGKAGSLAEDAAFMTANAQFAQAADPLKPLPDKYKEALASYKNYLKLYPSGKFAEEVSYRVPLTEFQIGNYEAALAGFQDFAKKRASSDYAGDVGYRIALCYQAANHYDDVIKQCGEWLKKRKGEPMEAEVLALRGDAYAAKDMPKESASSYRAALEITDREEVQKYVVMEASKQYQKAGDWDAITQMFTKFVQNHPDSTLVVPAAFWISKAKAKQGKIPEAKLFLSQTIEKNIGDRTKDTVEMLLTQLAQLCSKRPRAPLVQATPPADAAGTNTIVTNTVASNAVASDASQTNQASADAPRPTPTPLPPYDAPADLALYLSETNAGSTAIGLARLRFTQAQLAGLTKHPEKQKELMNSIYRDFEPERLSAFLLSECGTLALNAGDPAKAATFYQELIKSFPKSDLLEYAYCGMGDVALAMNKPADALRWYTDAVEKAQADAKMADITYGKGRALVELGRYDEASKTLQEVVANKEWRGAVTAKAILALGDMETKRGNTAGGIQYYQRVFVAYQRYPEVVIPAYMKAADGFIKLGQAGKAAAHLKEMLSKPRLAAAPQAAEVKAKLATLPEPTPEASPSPESSPSASASPEAAKK